MPLVRYFVCVGGALLALLFLADATLPKAPVEADVAQTDKQSPILRVSSDRKWPERIVFDTSNTATLPVAAANVAAPQSRLAGSDVNQPATGAEDRIRGAFAELQPPDTAKADSKAKTKRRLAGAVAKKHAVPPTMLAAQRQQFGFSANSTW